MGAPQARGDLVPRVVGVDRLPRVRDLALTRCAPSISTTTSSTEEVVAFLAREGARLDTRIVETRDGRFARIGRRRGAPAARAHVRSRGAARRHGPPRHRRAGGLVHAVRALRRRARRRRARRGAGEQRLARARSRARTPARFAPLASVPLQAPERAARELERAHGLGLRGVEIPARAGELELDDPRLEPFWSAAEALGDAGLHPPVRGVAARRAGALCALAAGREPVRHRPRRDAARAGRRARAPPAPARSCSTTAAARFRRCSRGSRRATS